VDDIPTSAALIADRYCGVRKGVFCRSDVALEVGECVVVMVLWWLETTYGCVKDQRIDEI